ncbi:cytochrome c oxidase, subunit VIb [Globomyces pollinis-pini]|nr:cytochrome c oxidase, subunit VIb [Globomyces pollinis-pini]KAJ2992147.1 Cytochrome c oxidase subunit 6B [Globomyces sp. JEL0801]
MSEAEEQRPLPTLKTAGFDARFPNQNQTKNCWQNYVDYHKCVKVKGEDFAPCHQFRKTFTSICPTKWIDKWDEQREENIFPALVETHAAEHH